MRAVCNLMLRLLLLLCRRGGWWGWALGTVRMCLCYGLRYCLRGWMLGLGWGVGIIGVVVGGGGGGAAVWGTVLIGWWRERRLALQGPASYHKLVTKVKQSRVSRASLHSFLFFPCALQARQHMRWGHCCSSATHWMATSLQSVCCPRSPSCSHQQVHAATALTSAATLS